MLDIILTVSAIGLLCFLSIIGGMAITMYSEYEIIKDKLGKEIAVQFLKFIRE